MRRVRKIMKRSKEMARMSNNREDSKNRENMVATTDGKTKEIKDGDLFMNTYVYKLILKIIQDT